MADRLRPIDVAAGHYRLKGGREIVARQHPLTGRWRVVEKAHDMTIEEALDGRGSVIGLSKAKTARRAILSALATEERQKHQEENGTCYHGVSIYDGICSTCVEENNRGE